MESAGIVLRHYPYSKHKIAVLDQKIGRVDLFLSFESRAMVGSFMHYTLEHKKNNYYITLPVLVDIPFVLAKTDLLFFHHVLELIYFFVPEGTPAYDLFDLALFLYDDSNYTWLEHMQLKKIFLCKLLLSVGVYCETSLIRLVNLKSVLALPIDMIDPESLDLADEKKIDQWLEQCVSMHPAISKFKTVHFLMKNRIG